MSLITNPFATLIPDQSAEANAYFINNNIVIESSPRKIAASSNAAQFQFSASAITDDNNYASVTFGIADLPVDGTVLIFSAHTSGDFQNFSIQAKAEPAINEFYSDLTTPTKTKFQIADSICASLNSNLSFNQRFIALQSNESVTIEALAVGERFNMDMLISFGDTSKFNLSGSTYSSNKNIAQTKKDWALFADLYIGSTGDLAGGINRQYAQFATSYEFLYNESNLYNVNCAGALKNYVSTPIPTIGFTDLELMNSPFQNYFLIFGEKYDEFRNNFKRKFFAGQTQVRWIVNSSLPFDSVNDLSGYTVFNSAQFSTMPFMTYQPVEKEIFLNSKECLTFLYGNDALTALGAVSAYMKCDVNYFDGSEDLNEFTFATTNIYTHGGMYCVDVSPERFFGSDNTHNGKLIKSYTVRLYITITQGLLAPATYTASREQTYDIIHDCPLEGEKYFRWRNQLGGWDTITMNGQLAEDFDRKITSFNIPLELHNSYVAYSSIDTIEYEPTNVSYSNYMNKEHFEWARELFKSGDVRVLNNGEWQRIIINKGEGKGVTNDDLYKVQIEWQYGIAENYIKN